MTGDRQQLLRTLVETRELPEGPVRSVATESVVAEIEAAGPRSLLPLAYHCLIWAYQCGAELEKSFVPFSKQLRLYDAEPELFDAEDVHRMLWAFKWMTVGLWKFPTVSRIQIERTIEDMERRYARANQGLHAVHQIRFAYAAHRGDWAAAHALWERAAACPRDRLSDCAACAAHEHAAYHAARGDDAAAALHLDSIIGGGLACATEPHGALGTALLPYLRLGRPVDARSAHIRGYGMIRRRLMFQSTLAEHLQFLAQTHNVDRGLELLAEHRSMLTAHDHPLGGMTFLASAGLLLQRAADLHGADTMVPDLGDSTVGALATDCRERAVTVAADFDERNATGWQSERVLAILDARPLVPVRLGLPVRPIAAADALVPVVAEPPVGVVAELIGAEGLDLPELVVRAGELSSIGHPAAAALWTRVAALAGPDADEQLLAQIDDGIGRDLAASDPFASRERLDQSVRRQTGLGDERRLAVARSRAAVAAALTGDHETAVTECAEAGVVLERLGSPLDQLHHLYRRAYVQLSVGLDEAGRSAAAALFRQHVELAEQMGQPADATQSRIILIDRLDELVDLEAAAVAWQDCASAALAAGRAWWLPHLGVRVAQARLAAGWFPDRATEIFASLDDAVRFGDEWGDARPAAFAAYLRAELLGDLGAHDEAAHHGFEALRRAEDAGMDTVVTDARVLLGLTYHELERDHEAVAYLQAALPAVTAADNELLFRVRYRMGVSLRRLGEAAHAAEQLGAASEIAEAAGVPGTAAHAANLVGVSLEQAEPAEAAVAYVRAARLFALAGEEMGVVRMYRAQAAALTDAGRFDDALAALREAGAVADGLTLSVEVDPAWERAEVDDQSARVLAVAGRGVEAVQRALSAEQRHLEAGAPSDAAYAATLAAQVTLDLLEDPAAAEPVARRALAHAQAAEDTAVQASAALALADVLDAQGRAAEATDLRDSVGFDTDDFDSDDEETADEN